MHVKAWMTGYTEVTYDSNGRVELIRYKVQMSWSLEKLQ